MTNIVEQVIATPPASYEAYLYQYTNLVDGKAYVGIHKGSVDDTYNHSSTNEEFQKVSIAYRFQKKIRNCGRHSFILITRIQFFLIYLNYKSNKYKKSNIKLKFELIIGLIALYKLSY